jgi:hypothetical protein
MPTSIGTNTVGENHLIFAIDTHDIINGITPLGCGGFNGSNQGIKNLLDGTIYGFENGIKLSGRNYFTAFAIDYPESVYGGDAASRQGISIGYDVRSGGGLYGASRALHLWVWNNDTNSWIDNGATTYFNGARLAGHCYDNYTGAETGYLNEISKFITDYNNIKNLFPNCTYIVAGSHRADQYTSSLRNILYDLGMPTGYIDSDYIPAPEWILVGEPGLKSGNAFGWVYENYTTNPNQVAHMNFGLPIRSKGGVEFDGTNDYIQTNVSGTYSQITYEFIGFFDDPTLNTYTRNESAFGDWIDSRIHFGTRWSVGMHWNVNNIWNVIPTTNLRYGYNHYCLVWDNLTNRKLVYINGKLSDTATTNGNLVMGDFKIGVATNLGAYYRGNIPVFRIYDVPLNGADIKKNYEQYKTRFNLT